MIRITVILPAEKAGIIQNRHADFDCTLQGIAITSNMSAKVILDGPENKMRELFGLIGEELPSEE